MGGWVKPQLEFFFLGGGFSLSLCCFHVSKCLKKKCKIGGWVMSDQNSGFEIQVCASLNENNRQIMQPF